MPPGVADPAAPRYTFHQPALLRDDHGRAGKRPVIILAQDFQQLRLLLIRDVRSGAFAWVDESKLDLLLL